MNIGQHTEFAVSVYAMSAVAQVGSASTSANPLLDYQRLSFTSFEQNSSLFESPL